MAHSGLRRYQGRNRLLGFPLKVFSAGLTNNFFPVDWKFSPGDLHYDKIAWIWAFNINLVEEKITRLRLEWYFKKYWPLEVTNKRDPGQNHRYIQLTLLSCYNGKQLLNITRFKFWSIILRLDLF